MLVLSIVCVKCNSRLQISDFSCALSQQRTTKGLLRAWAETLGVVKDGSRSRPRFQTQAVKGDNMNNKARG